MQYSFIMLKTLYFLIAFESEMICNFESLFVNSLRRFSEFCVTAQNEEEEEEKTMEIANDANFVA